MNKLPNQNNSKTNCEFEEDEIFDDSSFLAKFDNTSFKESRFSENNINTSHNNSGLNVSALCCDEEISGYDKLTGKTWIYPTNYPIRDYQFNIIKAAILKNTLVSLPTGLGKTFIAAVIMYNFYRWYPLGKIVFTAPTRPLVAQQIDACYNIIGIPPKDTIEMTGHMQVNTRKMHWQNKRVFFATPQVIYNDIKSGICPGDKIRCLVIDEAHRARGNYAYCQIVSTLSDMGHKTYRILALSATPGSKVEDVISVVKTLQIAHLELRTEGCIDVAPYSHSRKINTVIIQLGHELSQLRQQYVEILDGYARRLKQFNILPQNLGNLSKGRVVMLYKEFQNKERGSRHPQHNYIMKDFTLLIALYHGLELLVKHGSRVFLNFFDEHPEKSWIQSDDRLTALLERLRDDLGVDPLSLNRSILPDGTIPEMPKDLSFGHPKFYRLKEIMLEHFTRAKKNGQDTRAIVFCEYRESVNLVHCLLLQCRPLITPQMFVGQGASGKDGKTVVSQKQQLRVMRSFREGACNTLVATCVAEEGLDVGSVDLILCFDISSRSPVRLVQRCGRTGRERGGQVFILVTEGREHQTLMDCMRQRDGLNKKILQSQEVKNNLYKQNPRMMPHDFTPECQKMYITVAKKVDPKDKTNQDKDSEKAKRGQKDLRTMLLGKSINSSSSSSKEFEATELITEEEFKEIFPQGITCNYIFHETKEQWAKNKETIINNSKTEDKSIKLHSWLEWQRTLQKTVNIGHSKDTEILAELLQYSDAKRFEMPPSTQNPTFNTQDFATQNILLSSPVKQKAKPKKSKPVLVKSPLKLIKSPGKRDGDIRALFSTATKSTKNYTKLINDLGIQNDGSIPTRLINLLVDLSLENTNDTKTCYFCQNICDCSFFTSLRKHRKQPSFSLNFVMHPKLPDIDLIDDMTIDSIKNCAQNEGLSQCLNNEKVVSKSPTYTEQVEWGNSEDVKIASILSDDDIVEPKNCSNNFNLEFDFDSPEDVKTQENKPEIKVIKEKVDAVSNNNFELEFDFDTLDNFDLPKTQEQKVEPPAADLDKNFEIGDIEDIFAESSPEEVIKTEIQTETKIESPSKTADDEKPEAALGFFGLDSIEDIFADYDESIETKPNKNPSPERSKTNINAAVNKYNANVSPSILSGRPKNIAPTSPILCSQGKKFQLSTKKKNVTSTPTSNVRRQLIKDPVNISTVNSMNQKSTTTRSSLQESNNQSLFTITQLVEMINKTDDKSHVNQSNAFSNNMTVNNDEDRSTSPILLTQADRKKGNSTLFLNKNKSISSQTGKSESLIILDSDSDSNNDTQEYEIPEIKDLVNTTKVKKNIENASPVVSKRKFDFDDDDDFMSASPYFNKKPRLDNTNSKPLTLQEKVLAALTSKNTAKPNNSNNIVNFSMSPEKIFSQKENKDPLCYNDDTQCDSDNEKECVRKNNLEMLQMFRRDSQVKSPKEKFKLMSSNHLPKSQKRKLKFDDSDDDFIENKTSRCQKPVNGFRSQPTTNHKVRKKKSKKANGLLDLEASLSDSGGDSGDELTDDSAGSIVDFICDDADVTHEPDMHAHYIRSVKSPVKGVFKIPELPKKFNNLEVFSQFVEEDNYEMDSFCVDSHIGLTQANDMSDLEVAEMLLEEKKREKKKSKTQSNPIEENGDSPVVRRKYKNARQIQSDSDDSS